MLTAIAACIFVVVLTIAIHAGGTTLWVRFLFRRYHAHDLPGGRDRWFIFVFTALTLMVLHLVEVLAWAVALLALPTVTKVATFEQALYFSLVTFTTLGYGDITLNEGVRLLSGVEAMNGILLFGWSTAFLFAVMQRVWKMSGEGGPVRA